MGSSVAERIARSAQDFRSHVWPIVGPFFGPGELVSVEMADSPLNLLLDRHAHIDYFFRPLKGLALGLGSRISDSKRDGPVRRFTMGDAEHKHLVAALARPVGQVIPAIHIQASVDRSNDGAVTAVDSVGLVRTADLIRLGEPVQKRNQGPNGSYWSWEFDALVACGVPLTEIPDPRLHDPFLAA